MTYYDIYEKFLIEYDKANITSSYPSLTPYEVATILDKAYLALIGLKITGNNSRRVNFQLDIKSVEDLRPIIRSKVISESTDTFKYASNEKSYVLPVDLLYYLQSTLHKCSKSNPTSIDKISHDYLTVKLVSHAVAQKFMATDNNLPWIDTPVCFIENRFANVLVDSYKLKDNDLTELYVTYIKNPDKFVDILGTSTDNLKVVTFELSDAMAEELINLAIVFATNTVESPKLKQQVELLNLES